MIPDCEAIVYAYLKDHPAIVGLGARVVDQTPVDTSSNPWVLVTQLDDQAVAGHRSEHLFEFLLQMDCYASVEGDHPEASLLNRTVRAALAALPEADHDNAVVTGVELGGATRIPDTEFEPARERFSRDVTIWIHPT